MTGDGAHRATRSGQHAVARLGGPLDGLCDRGIQAEMVKLDGSIELAPLVVLAERIVDLVQSGETLRANGLVEVAEILTSTARLIVNRASLKTAHSHVNQLITAMRHAVAGRPERVRE